METENIFCTFCGSANRLDARFCFKCGNAIQNQPLNQTAPPSLQSAPAVPPAVSINQPPRTAPPKSDFITLACPNCGGKLNITSDLERFACNFCGNEHIVRRAGGTVSLEPVMQMMNTLNASMSRVSAISEKQAAEMAIKRLNKEIEELQKMLAQLHDNSNNSWLIFGISAFLAVFSIFVMGITGDEKIIRIIFVPVLILSIFMAIIGLIVLIAVSSDKKKKLKLLEADISKKLADLALNKQIANS
jgi:ribosomal protein S27E